MADAFRTRFNRDGTVTVWDVYSQGWKRLRPSQIGGGIFSSLSPREQKRIERMLEKQKQRNPVKGRKVKGGKAVSLKNFTGTVVRTTRGQVVITGKGKKK